MCTDDALPGVLMTLIQPTHSLQLVPGLFGTSFIIHRTALCVLLLEQHEW
jgi:hypothetical protein